MAWTAADLELVEDAIRALVNTGVPLKGKKVAGREIEYMDLADLQELRSQMRREIEAAGRGSGLPGDVHRPREATMTIPAKTIPAGWSQTSTGLVAPESSVKSTTRRKTHAELVFDATEDSKWTDDWLAPELSPVELVGMYQKKMRDRVRSLARNAPWFVGLIRTWVDQVIGAAGSGWLLRAKSHDDDLGEELNEDRKTARQAGYDQALAEIEERRLRAVEEADTEAFQAAEKDREELGPRPGEEPAPSRERQDDPPADLATLPRRRSRRGRSRTRGLTATAR